MSFWDKAKATADKWMNGRNGADMLGAASLWGGLLLTILDLFLRTGALTACGLVLYGYSIFRMFSKNKGKRAHENNRFTRYVTEHKKSAQQRWLRIKNFRKYKYFRCTKCRSLMRLARGSGTKTIRCPRCQNTFDKKA